MKLQAYNEACAALPVAFKTIQWRGAHVWKVGDVANFKVFAIGVPSDGTDDAACRITLKVGLDVHPILMELDGVGAAPHLRLGGWLSVSHPSAIDDETLAHHLATSHRLAAASLTKRQRAALGLG